MMKSNITTTRVLDREGHIVHQYVSFFQEFNRQGRMTNEIIYNAAGEVESKSLFTYNEEGRLLEQVIFEHNDRLVERVDHFFDESGQLVQTEITIADGSKTIKEYHYDPVEKIERAVLNSMHGEIEGYEIFWYGGENEVIAEIKSDVNSRVEYKRFATYDGAGNLIMEEIFGRDEAFKKRTNFTYLPGGLLSKIVTQDKHGKDMTVEKIIYDEQQLPIKKILNDKIQGSNIKTCFFYNAEGQCITEKVYENDVLTLKKAMKYDTRNNVIEEECIHAVKKVHEIKKHVIEYW